MLSYFNICALLLLFSPDSVWRYGTQDDVDLYRCINASVYLSVGKISLLPITDFVYRHSGSILVDDVMLGYY